MSGKSKIEWTEKTWNPTTGCSKVSPGCKHCYAERLFPRAYPGRAFTDVQCHEDRLDAPLHWRKPSMIFVNSMSDLFHELVPDEFIDQVFAVMALCPQHTFQILTKRPERMWQYMDGLLDHVEERISQAGCDLADSPCAAGIVEDGEWPLLNVWLGVSVENQKTSDERIPILLQTPAAVRFISAEPLLGDVNLIELPSHSGIGRYLDALSNAGVDPGAEVATKLDWVICGGESGPKARPMHPKWARSLRDQCVAAGVPFFFKQWGEWGPDVDSHKTRGGFLYKPGETWLRVDGLISNTPGKVWAPFEWATMRRYGKHAAGRLLDGREWSEYPERVA